MLRLVPTGSRFDRPILVAIDMVAGEVVRLTKGEMDRKTVYGQDPVAAALEWKAAGARWLHLVDLDGATGTGIDNSGPIARIVEAVDLPIQIGGGIRTLEAIERWLDVGVTRVCIGTKSMDADFMSEAVGEFGDRLVASLDTKNGMVQVRGWTEGRRPRPLDGIKQLLDCGVSRIMFTDIERDGTLAGPEHPGDRGGYRGGGHSDHRRRGSHRHRRHRSAGQAGAGRHRGRQGALLGQSGPGRGAEGARCWLSG